MNHGLTLKEAGLEFSHILADDFVSTVSNQAESSKEEGAHVHARTSEEDHKHGFGPECYQAQRNSSQHY